MKKSYEDIKTKTDSLYNIVRGLNIYAHYFNNELNELFYVKRSNMLYYQKQILQGLDSNRKEFLFKNKGFLIDVLYTYLPLESESIKLKEITEDNQFFKDMQDIITKSYSNKQNNNLFIEFKKFLFLYSLENPHFSKKWTQTFPLENDELAKLIFQEIYKGKINMFNFFLSKFDKEGIVNMEYIKKAPDNKTNKPLNLREYIAYTQFYNVFYKRHIALYKKINQDLNLPFRIDHFLDNVSLKSLVYHKLISMDEPAFHNVKVDYLINDKMINVSLIDASKYNSMVLNLNSSVNGQPSYGLDGLTYNTFDEIVKGYSKDTFLKEHIGDFMRKKAEKAKSNKAKWNYQLFDLEFQTKDNKSIIKKNKI